MEGLESCLKDDKRKTEIEKSASLYVPQGTQRIGRLKFMGPLSRRRSALYESNSLVKYVSPNS